MLSLIHLGLLLFILYLPVFFFVLFYLAPKKYPDFSFKTHWISNLGEKKSKSYPCFTTGLLLLSFLGFLFLLGFYNSQGSSLTNQLTFLSGLSVLFSIFLITFFPMDVKLITHMRIARFLFFSLVIFNLTLLPKFNLLNLLEIILLILFGISCRLLFYNYPLPETVNLVKIRRSEKSLLVRNATILEWLVFLVQLIWLLLTALYLFLGL